MELDVGCGPHPRGDVNCDLYIKLRGEGVIEPKHIPNFVLCDGQFLPFKEDVFDVVYCFHVIEHVENPFLLLRELIRVSKDKVLLKCPHRYSPSAKHPYHLHYFSQKRIARALEKMNVGYEIQSRMAPFPHKYLPIIQLPLEIIVHIHKEWGR